jgi:pimeloyl-ACP methyl ester carboxylesterase
VQGKAPGYAEDRGRLDRLLAAAIPGSRLIRYPDTGHLIVWERPQQVAADIAAFTTQFAHRRSSR